MADTATAIIAGSFSLATAMGTMYMQDFLARRRAGTGEVKPGTPPRRSKRRVESDLTGVRSTASISPPQPQWSALPEPFFKRYGKSLKIAFTGLIVGALVGQDYENINPATDPDNGAGGMFGLAYVILAIVVPAYLFYARRVYALTWDYWAYFIDCAILLLCFAAGIGFTSKGESPDQMTNVFTLMFGMSILALVPAAIVGFFAGRIFYKPKNQA